MHEIVEDLFHMCCNNVSINLKSLLNTIENDVNIKSYSNVKTYSSWSYLFFYNYGDRDNYATPAAVYNYEYMEFLAYDDNYGDWFNVGVLFSRPDVLMIDYHNSNLAYIHCNKCSVNLTDEVYILQLYYNNSTIANINLFELDAELIGFDLWRNLFDYEDCYKTCTSNALVLLERYKNGKEIIEY